MLVAFVCYCVLLNCESLIHVYVVDFSSLFIIQLIGTGIPEYEHVHTKMC